MAVEDFGVDRKSLETLLNWVDSGELQLPDFQRGWVWPQSNISSLIASLSLGYPTGTLMLLQTGGATNFKARLVEGVESIKSNVIPQRLILDGLFRIDIMKLETESGGHNIFVVNELEGVDSNYSSKDPVHEASTRTFLQQHWKKIISDKLEKLMQ